MTKSISFNLKAEMTGTLSTLATCMRIERTDGRVYGFTTHDKILSIDGLDYEPAASFNPSDIKSGNNMEVDNLTVEGVLSSDAITEDELRAGRWDYAAFQIFMVNWADLTMGDYKQRAGHLGEVSVHHQTFSVELLGLMDAYNTSIGKLTQPLCRTFLGSTLCKVVLTGSPSRVVDGTITTADTDFFTLHDSSRTEPDGYFDEGTIVIHYATGDLSYEVKAYIPGVWITKTPFAYDASGVTYTMTQGCNRLFDTCVNTFGNAVNFRGEPWLRGPDALAQIGRHNS